MATSQETRIALQVHDDTSSQSTRSNSRSVSHTHKQLTSSDTLRTLKQRRVRCVK